MDNIIKVKITGNEARQAYFLKIILQLLTGSAIIFGLMNLYLEKPLIIGLYNLAFGVIFMVSYYAKKFNFYFSMMLIGLMYQAFIFGHAYFLLSGKQLEAGLGIFTAVLPIFVMGYRLWFFFITNFILYHIALLNAGYENLFYFQYGFYIVMFIMINAILKENQQYERELIIQRDKIKRDATILQEVDELKTRFFANISHEFRTPLTLILSPMESILKSNELSNKNYTFLRLMQQNGEKLLKRINELLELSRLDAKRLEIIESPINIYQLTKQITATFEGAANLKNIDLDYINDIDKSVNLKLDIPKVEMIISNYLSNAIKFTPEKGNITVYISKADNQLQISVQDTGIGIPKESLQQVFNRFYQVKGQDYQVGTGIGLALCKELAEFHKGKVWVESEPDQGGSIFYLQLPFKETYAPIVQETMAEIIEETEGIIEPIPSKSVKETVLIVEDNADLRLYIKLLLEEKYKVIIAKNGQKALERLAETQPSLIISDIMMPIMDGITLLKKLKSDDRYRAIPVIMLTAQKHTDVKIETLRIGVDDYLTKPFHAAELVARVDNLIQNASVKLAEIPVTKTKLNTPKISDADIKWLATIESKILENISNSQFKLNDLAYDLLITPRSLQQRVKTLTGQTPKKYQRSIKLHHARKLLKSGTIKTVAELSYELGFEDQHYFSKLYKIAFGITPRAELDQWKNL